MRVLVLRGSHYEMGLQHGQQARDLGATILATLKARIRHLEQRADLDDAVRQVETAWQKNAPSTIAMLKGIADGLTIQFARLFRYAIASYLDDLLLGDSKLGIASHRPLAMTDKQCPETEACTVWAAAGLATRDGAPILTKNRDYTLAHLPLQMLADAAPQSGYRYLYVTSAGSPAVFSSGMNEKGLAVADTHVSSRDIGPGLARYTLMMNLLEQHASVASALAYLRETLQMGAGNLALADAQGDLAVCESGYRQCGFIAPLEHTVVATNHFVSAQLRDAYLEHPPGARAESQARHAVVRTVLQNVWGRWDVEKTQALMSRHEEEQTAICRHNSRSEAVTISNAIFLPAERKLLFCNSQPCQGSYSAHAL